jgi:hypothetical protein
VEAKMINGEANVRANGSTPEVPWLGVHVLSEFTFCPRAGLIAMGQARTDWGDDYWLRPNLDFRPSYALYELRREIAVACLLATALGIGFGIVLAGNAWLLTQGNTVPLIGGVLLLIALAWPLSQSLARLTSLVGQWRRILSLTPREPDPTVGTPQPVVWWEMLRAGYDPIRLPEPIHSTSSRLTGQPWRVLRKGDLQIPVFRVEGDNPGRLYPKHAVRAAAYCALLEQATGARSPYAIALFAGTYNGWTFPNTPESRSFFDQVLTAARSFLSPDLAIGPPTSTNICLGCPHGCPRVYKRGESETRLFDGIVRPKGSSTREGLSYHSTCGDQFAWTPPHAQAVALGLRVDQPQGASN